MGRSKKYLVVLMCVNTAISAFGIEKPKVNPDSAHWLNNSSHIYEVSAPDNLKTYYLKTSSELRDKLPESKEVEIRENSHLPFTRTNSPMFDGLFSLALQEMVQSSVSVITDHSFEPASCECFETGEKWKYVWTRDIAYATHLGLGSLDPKRSMNSLSFKISNFRNDLGIGEQIVQDTGTGGSWPISTDRIIWALGAYETLMHLPSHSQDYQSFLERSYHALKNSVLVDRQVAYDSGDGLYAGEQSFLDWREQSYPSWTRAKVIHIGMSKSLSTNVAQYIALKRLSDMAIRLNDLENSQKFVEWSKQLKKSIIRNFWDGNSLRSLKLTFLDQRAVKYYDLLGISLAILEDIPSNEQAMSALTSYPQTLVGLPVIWPQQQGVPIYHNRAIWPFVSAYALKAAKKIQAPNLVTTLVKSLMLGSAQNLSNMENFEFLTLRNWFNDGVLSGPVVNSRRQLWSTAGYLSMVLDVVFGKEVKQDSIRFNPTMSHKLRKEIFANSSVLNLKNIFFQEKHIDVEVHLPKNMEQISEELDGIYRIGTIKLNGKVITNDHWINVNELSSDYNLIQVNLEEPRNLLSNSSVREAPKDIFKLTSKEREVYFQPKSPVLSPITVMKNSPMLSYFTNAYEDVAYLIFKNGKLLTTTNNTHYVDKDHSMGETACYSIVAQYNSSKNESFPSEPTCYWPSGAIKSYPIDSENISTVGGSPKYATAFGRIYFEGWGAPDQKILLKKIKPHRSGKYALQVDYNNIDRINTGITCGVKKVSVYETATGALVKQGAFMLPHHGEDRFWTDSNFIQVDLKSSKTYSIVIEDFQNMSYFSHFKSYKYRGGEFGYYNRINFSDIKLLFLESSSN